MKLFLVPLILALTISVSIAGNIHVGPGEPWPDVNSASHARAIHAGDTVYVHAGTYGTSPYYIDSLIGKPDAWIVIRPYGDDSVSIHVAWLLQTVQYVRFTGLNFHGNDPAHSSEVYHLMQFDYAYDCYTRNHDIVIDHCNFTDLNNTGKQGSGAFLKFTGCGNFIVDSCVFRNGTNVADGISMNGNRNGVIRNCRFENISGYGSHTKGGTKNILYERNLFIDCASAGLDVGGDTGPQFFCPLGAPWECDSIKVYSNIFIGGRVAVQLSSAHHAFVVNNTCFKQSTFSFRLLNASSNNIYVDSNFIANNIFTTTGAIYLNASSNYQYLTTQFYNNLFYSYSGNEPAKLNWSEVAGVVEANNLIANPDFVDTSSRDFNLRGSALINSGLSVIEPRTDYVGHYFNPRYRIIGALETPILRSVQPSAEANSITVTPNPASSTLSVRYAEPAMTGDPLSIVDDLGRVVLRSGPGSTSIDVSRLAAGGYFLKIRRQSIRFVVEH